MNKNLKHESTYRIFADLDSMGYFIDTNFWLQASLLVTSFNRIFSWNFAINNKIIWGTDVAAGIMLGIFSAFSAAYLVDDLRENHQKKSQVKLWIKLTSPNAFDKWLKESDSFLLLLLWIKWNMRLKSLFAIKFPLTKSTHSSYQTCVSYIKDTHTSWKNSNLRIEVNICCYIAVSRPRDIDERTRVLRLLFYYTLILLVGEIYAENLNKMTKNYSQTATMISYKRRFLFDLILLIFCKS